MPNPVLIGAKLNMKRNSLTTVEGKLTNLLKKRSEFEASIEGIDNEEDLAALETSIQENEDAITSTEEEKTTLTEEIEELEKELEASNRRSPDKGAKRNMPKNMETREAINAYVRTKDNTRSGFTSVEGGALIPEELLAPQKEKVDTVDLTKYVRTVPVNRGSGKYPIIKKSNGKMVSVAELAKNPELAHPTFDEVKYDISTYRGYIPVSQEAIDDADYDMTGLIAEDIQDQDLNTKNAQIAAIFQSAKGKVVTGLDGIVTLLNTGFKQVYNVKFYVSSSLFNELDLLKDKNGRYLLQDDITVASGKRVKGREVVVLDDEIIGKKKGDVVGFVGDAYEFCTLFNRKQASVKWIDNDIYGQLLAGYVRFDVKSVDKEAGYYVTYKPEEPAPSGDKS
ncbi:phage major capsid protein [Bacillus thuringiensis]|uniref:phage major capsid protein n=1 Tax=Bacillus thuringiensis TaxID=1428 RepID=UPI0026E45FAC|nr:phage major capsid protein [Bacillus thuringiensis]MDO6631770.1 phage major capsid protein [Bacillus thuringiensis]MDO6661399.1 phage major capsid protein [Bacillus thuringiensis]MDO6701910.1 phage major capsid protein [Bacillus thuringiensis]